MQGIILLLIHAFCILCPLTAAGTTIGTGVCFTECFDAYKKRIAIKLKVI